MPAPFALPSPATWSRRLLLSSLASAAGLIALPGCAHESRQAPGLALLEVVDRDSGQVLQSYHHQGRRFVAGRPGARYALRLRNLGGGRLLVVLSVDGVNVISGETADWNQTGYVLEPGRSHDINGWRKSEREVAAFEFAPLEQSYAARTGRPDDVGVIGMAVFRERPVPPPPVAAAPPALSRQEDGGGRAAAAPAAPAAGASEWREKSGADASTASRLGTGHGQREWSLSRRTAFERASATPEQQVQIEYDSFERLAAAGVIPRVALHGHPRPFPHSPTTYVPDPPRW
ncbi:MAG: hypothetical protein U1F56_25570 [Rubrivivax sp.]